MSEFREKLTTGKDVVDPKTWAGALPAAFGIAPRMRIGANRWFNLLWLLPIGWGVLLVAVAAAQHLRGLPEVQAFILRHPGTGSSAHFAAAMPVWLRVQLHAIAANHGVTANTAALMCAEAVPWRCHRSLVADALTVRGARVEHITGAGRSRPHRLTPFARVDGTRITYPGGEREGVRLATRAPFHLEATVRVLQRRPTNLVDAWKYDRYQRVLMTPGGVALVEVANEGTVDTPDVRFRVLRGKDSEGANAALVRTLRRMLGLDVDPGPLQRLVEAEQRLHRIAVALRGMRPPRFSGLFEAFASVVPFQQVSLDAGVAVVSRLVDRFGESVEYDGSRVHAFPAASAIAGTRLTALRKCGVSLRKAETLRNAARAIESGDVTEEKLARMNSHDAIRFLTELPGIGPWSAALILLRGMGRLDVFPPGDVGAARGLSELLRLPPGRSLTRHIERFGEHRGYLYFCSLGGALLARGLIHAAPREPSY